MSDPLFNKENSQMVRFTRPYSMLPPVVKFLLITNTVIFLLEMATGYRLIEVFALWPLTMTVSPGIRYIHAHFELYQLVTYAFLHGNPMHLFLNMYALWLFGTRMENVWGQRAFTIYYFVCVIGAGLVQLLVSSMSGHVYPTIGASGGIFGVLLAFGLLFPNEKLLLLIPPMPIKAKWFVGIYAAIELWAGVTGTEAGVAHFAHLGGMLFGYLLIVYWKKHPPRYS